MIMLPRLQKHTDAISSSQIKSYSYSTYGGIITRAVTPEFLSKTNLDALNSIAKLLDHVHEYLHEDEKKCLQEAIDISNKIKSLKKHPETDDLKLLIKAAQIKQKAVRARKAAAIGNPFKECQLSDLVIINDKISELFDYIKNANVEMQEAEQYMDGKTWSLLHNELIDFERTLQQYRSILIDELISRIDSLPWNDRFDIQQAVTYQKDTQEWKQCHLLITRHGNESQKQTLTNNYQLIGSTIEGVPLPHGETYHHDKNLGLSFIEIASRSKSDEEMMKSFILMSDTDLEKPINTPKDNNTANQAQLKVVQEATLKLYDQEAEEDLGDSATWEKIKADSMTMSFILITKPQETKPIISTASTANTPMTIKTTTTVKSLPNNEKHNQFTHNNITLEVDNNTNQSNHSSPKEPLAQHHHNRNTTSLLTHDRLEKKSVKNNREFKVTVKNFKTFFRDLLERHKTRITEDQFSCWSFFFSHEKHVKTNKKVAALSLALKQLHDIKNKQDCKQFLDNIKHNDDITQSRGLLTSTLSEELKRYTLR